MLTKEDLLLEGIKPEENNEETKLALPPELSGKGPSAPAKKSHRLFSPALFKESMKSNRTGLAVVSAGNALIMIIIIGILSTLHVNSTTKALKDLFDNSDTEGTVKSSAISLYSTLSNTADAYLQYDAADNQLIQAEEKAFATVSDASVSTQLTQVDTVYNLAYAGASGTESQKQETAKAAALKVAEPIVSANSSYSEEEKKVILTGVKDYLDVLPSYRSDLVSARTDAARQDIHSTILKKSLPVTMTNVLCSLRDISEEAKRNKILAECQDAFDQVFNKSSDTTKTATESSFRLLKLIAPEDETGDFLLQATDDLQKAYGKDADAFMKDATIRQKTLSSSSQKFVFDTMEKFAYYEFLPDFQVDYVTSDRGYPVRYVGTGSYAPNGEEIQKQIEITSYNPSLYIKVGGDMGTTSTMLEKMHKEILTGSGYTDSEIQDAKNKADENLGQLRSELSSFMDDFLHRGSDGTNSYYDGKSLNHDALVSRVVTVVDDAARKQVVDAYNESHDVKVQSVDEITAENFMMDGNTLMALVQGYASSGIASYDSYYQQALSKSDYSRTDAMLVALVKGSRGVVDQLPTKVDESLVEMGGMNTYGIIVGVVAFGIATLLIPMVYTILLSNNLVAQKVESGSLAFTLSTPTTRNSFIFTEATYLLYSELVMGLALLLAAVLSQLVGVAAGGSDLTESLSLHDIGFYALGNFMVTVGISGICFLASCHFNKTNLAIGAGGGLTIFFFICSILGLFGTKAIPATVRIDAMGFFNYLTIDSLFDPIAVMEGNAFQYWFKLLWLLVIAGVTYTLGAVDFCHKDLPL